MISKDKQIQLVSEAINSAICIDNEYVAPFEESEGLKHEESKDLYKAFNNSGLCHLDIYTYIGKEEYDSKKESLLVNKDLVILDWELDPALEHKFQNTLLILEEICNRPDIHFVDIYTQEPDLTKIAFEVYGYFKSFLKLKYKEEVQKVENSFCDYIDSFDFEDVDSDKIKKFAFNHFNSFLMNPDQRNFLSTEFASFIQSSFNNNSIKTSEYCSEIKKIIGSNCYFKKKEDFFKAYCIINFCNPSFVSESRLRAKVLNSTTLLINGTIVTVTSKNVVKPNELFGEFAKSMVNLPQKRSLLLSLFVKQKINQNLASVGTEIGMIHEEALLFHCNNLSQEGSADENISSFLSNTIAEHVKSVLLNNSEIIEYSDLFKLEEGEKRPKATREKTLKFISMLTFLSVDRMMVQKHMIKTGDVFELSTPIVNKSKGSKDFKYLMCITKSCDTLRPEKVNNNFAFVLGFECDQDIAVKNAETDYYTYLCNGKTIQWDTKFLTIYLDNSEIELEKEKRSFSFDYQDEKVKAIYFGNQKETYAIRIINMVYSNAMKIGIDLPHGVSS